MAVQQHSHMVKATHPQTPTSSGSLSKKSGSSSGASLKKSSGAPPWEGLGGCTLLAADSLPEGKASMSRNQ